jgi:DNA-binding NtrC family response regulator
VANTTESVLLSRVPLRGLAVEVVAGPDKGKRFAATTDRVSIGTAQQNDLVLTDATVSRFHLDLVRRGERIEVLDHDSTNGSGLSGAILEGESVFVAAGTVIGVGKSRVRVADGATVNLETHAGGTIANVCGASPGMRLVIANVVRVASGDAPVLLQGESGTGKERVATAIHDLGPRAKKPFVTVDCAALAPTLIASELFGHEKGAFTGADRKRLGAFEQADGGTLLLDEVGELPTDVQSSLLGVLERRRFRRVGGHEEVGVDVRVISATHRDLRAEVNRGTFRLDLYYRLAVVVIRIPPLRERREDVAPLVEHFLRDAGFEGSVGDVIPPAMMTELASHSWPGNVRELRNLLEATIALGAPPEGWGASVTPAGSGPERPSYREAQKKVLDDFERRFLSELLARCEGNVARSAREARMNRSHLIDLLRKHGLK